MLILRGDFMCVNFMGEVYVLGGYYVSEFSVFYFFDWIKLYFSSCDEECYCMID